MNSASLDKKIATRVKKFNFAVKKGVLSIAILHSIGFLSEKRNNLLIYNVNILPCFFIKGIKKLSKF